MRAAEGRQRDGGARLRPPPPPPDARPCAHAIIHGGWSVGLAPRSPIIGQIQTFLTSRNSKWPWNLYGSVNFLGGGTKVGDGEPIYYYGCDVVRDGDSTDE